jgi:hypothetical protein
MRAVSNKGQTIRCACTSAHVPAHIHTQPFTSAHWHTPTRTHRDARARARARTHTHTHTHTVTQAGLHTHTRAHARTHACARARMLAHTHARTHACTNARTDERTNERTHARTHARTHTHIAHTQPAGGLQRRGRRRSSHPSLRSLRDSGRPPESRAYFCSRRPAAGAGPVKDTVCA